MDSLSASSQCTQLTVHSRFAIVLTYKLCTQVLEILIDLCVTGSYHGHAFTAIHKYSCTQSYIYACFMREASSVLYSRFPPSITDTNIHLHPHYFSLQILCLLALFYLDMLLHTL